jgi:hypothetical protein
LLWLARSVALVAKNSLLDNKSYGLYVLRTLFVSCPSPEEKGMPPLWRIAIAALATKNAHRIQREQVARGF